MLLTCNAHALDKGCCLPGKKHAPHSKMCLITSAYDIVLLYYDVARLTTAKFCVAYYLANILFLQ